MINISSAPFMCLPLKVIFCVKSRKSLLCNVLLTDPCSTFFFHRCLQQFPILAIQFVPNIQCTKLYSQLLRTSLQGHSHMCIVQDLACVYKWGCVLFVVLGSTWTMFVKPLFDTALIFISHWSH